MFNRSTFDKGLQPLAGTMIVIALLLPALATGSAAAQGQLQLPADLFVLTEAGQVLHIGAESGFAAAVTHPDQRVVDFGVAPDGQWIVFRTASGEESGEVQEVFLAVTSLDGQSGQVLAFEEAGQPPIAGRGQTLVWSPDAAAIAYTTETGLGVVWPGRAEGGAPRFQDIAAQSLPLIHLAWSPGGGFLAAESESNVWLVYRRESGMLYEAGQIPASAGAAWVREGVLALAPPGGGLVLLDVRSGEQTALLGGDVVVSQPTLITSGRLIFLVHESGGQRFAARRFGTVGLQGGDYEPTEASVEMTAAMRWMPDGIALLATLDGALTIIEPRTDTRRELMPQGKAYAWGPLPLPERAGVVMPRGLYFLARGEEGVVQLWRLPADGSPVEAITSEASSVLDFALSPDGTQIAYTAGGSLIVSNRDGSERHEVSPVAERPGAGAQPAWSPDGTTLAFARDGIWTVSAAGGSRTELITDNLSADTPPDQVRVYGRPRWSPDGTRLLISVGLYEGGGLGVLPVTGGEVAMLSVGSTQGTWLPNGLIVAWDYGFAYVTPGLYLVDPANPLTAVTILNESWHVYDTVVLANEAVVILQSTSGGDTLGPGSAQPFLVPVLPDALPIPHGQGGLIEVPVLSPDGAFAAGLREMHYGDYGPAGRLLILNLQTGERFAVQTGGEVWGLQWGNAP